MRKFSVGVRHYWAKATDLVYAGENQKLAIEIAFSIMLTVLTVYFAMHRELGIFFIGFLFPTIIIVLGTIFSIYFKIKDFLDKCD